MDCLRPAGEACPEFTLHRRSAPEPKEAMNRRTPKLSDAAPKQP